MKGPTTLLLALLLFAGTSSGQTPTGFSTVKSNLAPGSQPLAGIVALPGGGFYFFDGKAVKRVSGSQTSTVYTPNGSVFGSFIKVLPRKQALLFGESSKGTITEVGTGVLPYFRTLATIPYNFDCAFGPGGEILVSAAAASFSTNEVYLVDSQGNRDMLIQVAGPSGPIAVLPNGNLLLAVASGIWPSPPKSTRILLFPLAKWLGAKGPTMLTEKDGLPFLSGLDNIYDLTVDKQGRVYFSDTVNNTIWGYAGGTTFPVYRGGKESPTYIDLLPGNGPARFLPFQPGTGGQMVSISSDWVTVNNLLRINPRRPQLTVSPSGIIPANTKLTLQFGGGPGGGAAFLFCGLRTLAPEISITGMGIYPIFLGLDPTTLILPLGMTSLDGTGNGAIPALWPGGFATTLNLQAFFLTGTNPVSSTKPLALKLM